MRKLVLLTALLGVLIFVVACAAPTPTPAPKPTEPPKPTVAPTKAPEPTKVPELTKAPEPTKPAATVAPTAAPAAKPTLTVTLKKGLKWSDGAPFSAKDVVGTYNIFWAQSASAWNFLADVVAKDDYTIDFVMSNPSPIILRAVLRDNFIRPYSVYGKFMDQAAELRKANADRKGDEVKKLLNDLIAFKPDKVVTFGPFMVDPKSITEAQLTLVKNPTGYNADKIGFEKITVYYGDTKESMPLLLSQQLDYSTAAYPEANLKTLEGLKNIQLQPFTTGFGPGLWFNNDVYPLNKKQVRQAFAYILDRDEITKVAVGRGGTTVKMMAGFSDSLVDAWLSKDVQAKLNPYKKDLKKAEELLTKLGFKKGTDGVWVDDKGNKMAYELSVPADFTDWLGAAQSVEQQLKAFGIPITIRGFQSSERSKYVSGENKYQLLIDVAFRSSPPHPYAAWRSYMIPPANNPEATSGPKGLNWPFKQVGPDGKEVNISELVTKSAEGLDAAKQKPYNETLSLIYNDQLPVVAFFESTFVNPIDTQTRVTGWLPFTDKLYRNPVSADSAVAIQLLNGTLKPNDANKAKEFTTIWPYPQPPKGTLNYFDANSIPMNGVGVVLTPMQFPPFFWYLWADGKYEPVVAEKYEIK